MPAQTIINEIMRGLDFVSGLFIIIIGIMVSIIAISYMAGKAMKKEDWVVFAKVELIELLKSVVVFAVIAGMYVFLSMMLEFVLYDVAHLTIDPGQSVIEHVIGILKNISISLQNDFATAAELAHQMKLFQDAWSRTGPGGVSLKLAIYPGADSLLRTMEMLSGIGLMGIYSLTAQIIAFQMIEYATAYFFFPAGLVFRLIPTTRQAGNELIAIGIVLSLMLPFLYGLFFAAMSDIFAKHAHAGKTWENPITKHVSKSTSDPISFLSEGITHSGPYKIVALASPYTIYVTSNSVGLIKSIGVTFFFAIAVPTFAVTLAGSLIKGFVNFLNLDAGLSLLNR